ncbi:MAG TPA: hypothetical protein VFQ35_26425 [Polyangiaceae bacterium]|nr:hypothetical protein [Polyangiaceae bacterium]
MGGEAGTSTPSFGGAVGTGGVGGEGGVGGTATMGGVAGSATGGDSASGAGAGPISCEASFTTDTNDKGIGAGCAQINPPIEVAACPGKFSIARVLSDRWPKAENGQLEFGFCTKHCEIDSDCGTGFGCCEPRKGAFCLPYVENVLLPTGCTEPCATNHLNCGEGEICCERLGKVCVSDKCSGICPE